MMLFCGKTTHCTDTVKHSSYVRRILQRSSRYKNASPFPIFVEYSRNKERIVARVGTISSKRRNEYLTWGQLILFSSRLMKATARTWKQASARSLKDYVNEQD